MKIKLFLSIFAFFAISLSAINASFPVQQQTTSNSTNVVVKEQSDLTSPAAAAGSKSQIIALVLVALVGGLGIHRFYLGYTWQGVVQLLTAGGCGIWAIIDLVRIITGDLQPKGGKYDKTL